jgi:protein phosphatase
MSDPAGTPGEGSAATPEGIVVHVFARTDVGLLREHNEDDFLVADLTSKARTLMPDVQTHRLGEGGSAFVVCDGMGGAAAGEVASRAAVDTIYEHLTDGRPAPSWNDLVARLDHAIIEAGQRIYSMARADQERRGMGTTCTAAVLMDRRLFVAQVGDSRCYVLRGGALKQITRDQSLLTQLMEAGQVRPEDAPSFEHSNIILQALGTTEMVNTDVTFHDLCRSDTIMLCSDGLSGMVCDDAIREILVAHPDPLAACRALTEAANRGGGEDNITVVVARFEGAGLPEPSADLPVVFERYAKPRPSQFDRVPYTIPDQKFADGGPAIPSAPEVPIGAVSVAGLVPSDEGEVGEAAPAPGVHADLAAAAADAAGQAAASPRAMGPVEAAFDGTGSDLAEALRGAAEAPRVIEWSDEDVPLDDLPPTPRAAEEERPREGLRGWGLVAVLLLALVVALLVVESMRSNAGTEPSDAAGIEHEVGPAPAPTPPPAIVPQPVRPPAVEPLVPPGVPNFKEIRRGPGLRGALPQTGGLVVSRAVSPSGTCGRPAANLRS